MGDRQEIADRAADGHDDSQPHGKAHLKGFWVQPQPDLAPDLFSVEPVRLVRRMRLPIEGPQDPVRHVQGAAAENAHPSLRDIHPV